MNIDEERLDFIDKRLAVIEERLSNHLHYHEIQERKMFKIISGFLLVIVGEGVALIVKLFG